MEHMELRFGQWRIRSYRPEDLHEILCYADDREVSIQMRDRFPYPYTRKDAKHWLRYVSEQDPETNFAIATDTGLIGGIGLELRDDVEQGTAEVGYWLGKPYWGQGIATAALKTLIPWAFVRFDLVRLCGWVFESNPASGRVLEKCGFVLEGRLRQAIVKEGRRMDLFLYGLLRSEMRNGSERRSARSSEPE